MEKIDLKSVIQQHPGCTANRAKLKATLMDCYPQAEHRREINVILSCYDSGILSKLQEKDSLTTFETSALCMQIVDNYGFRDEYVSEALMAWGEAMGINIPVITLSKPVFTPELSRTVALVEGTTDDYDIEKGKNGWFITRFKGKAEETITIPSVIDGKMISGISEYPNGTTHEWYSSQGLFGRFQEIKTIIISEGIRILGQDTFRSSSLENIQLPSTLESIEFCTFQDSKLRHIDIPANVTAIGSKTFCSCDNLKSIKLPDSIVSMGYSVFEYCHNLEEVVLPKNLKEIGRDTFSCCKKLSSVVIPEGCQRICEGAFNYCESLTDLRIPSSVTKIDEGTSIAIVAELFGWSNPDNPDPHTPGAFDNSGLKVIYCAIGSAAEKYAIKHGIQCKRL